MENTPDFRADESRRERIFLARPSVSFQGVGIPAFYNTQTSQTSQTVPLNILPDSKYDIHVTITARGEQ